MPALPEQLAVLSMWQGTPLMEEQGAATLTMPELSSPARLQHAQGHRKAPDLQDIGEALVHVKAVVPPVT